MGRVKRSIKGWQRAQRLAALSKLAENIEAVLVLIQSAIAVSDFSFIRQSMTPSCVLYKGILKFAS